MTWFDLSADMLFVGVVVALLLYHHWRIRVLHRNIGKWALRVSHNRVQIVGIMKHHGIEETVGAAVQKATGNGGTPPPRRRHVKGKGKR